MAGADLYLGILNGFMDGLNKGLDKREERRVKQEELSLKREAVEGGNIYKNRMAGVYERAYEVKTTDKAITREDKKTAQGEQKVRQVEDDLRAYQSQLRSGAKDIAVDEKELAKLNRKIATGVGSVDQLTKWAEEKTILENTLRTTRGIQADQMKQVEELKKQVEELKKPLYGKTQIGTKEKASQGMGTSIAPNVPFQSPPKPDLSLLKDMLLDPNTTYDEIAEQISSGEIDLDEDTVDVDVELVSLLQQKKAGK